MTPGTLHRLLLWPLMTFVCSLTALVIYQMLTGKIRMSGLLIDPRTGQTSALRVQQLLATIAVAGTYAAAIHDHPPHHGLPHLDPQVLALMGGSNAIVLVNQTFHHVLQRLRSAVNPRGQS